MVSGCSLYALAELALPGAGELNSPLEIRLPTEAEWEYAARGTDERPYPRGKWQEGYANTTEAGLEQTIPVGLYPQGGSPFGVLDMSGQVWEWCLNKYDQKAVNHYTVDDSGGTRVLRGGSFANVPNFAACAFRDRSSPHLYFYYFGLRVVVAAPTGL